MKKKYYCGISEDWIKESLFDEFKRQSKAKQLRTMAKFYRHRATILRGVQSNERFQEIAPQEINVKSSRSK